MITFSSVLLKTNLSCKLIHKSRQFSNYAWQIEKYYSDQDFKPSQLVFNKDLKKPILYNPDEILVDVKAVSVNPLDLMMIKGYGKNLFDAANIFTEMTKSKVTYDKFPLTLGRDFSGIIKAVGGNVLKFKPGDNVWGSLSPIKQGSHCKYLVASEKEISLKPNNLTFEESASIPYVALTSWSAIFKNAKIKLSELQNKKVLVLGCSGGLGTFTIQLLKSYNCFLAVTCSKNANEFIKNIVNVDEIYDYNNLEKLFLEKQNYFDYIFDFTPKNSHKNELEYLKLLKKNFYSYYVSTSSPLLNNTDNNGILIGLLKTFSNATNLTLNDLKSSTNFRWAFYEANQNALEKIKELCENEKIKPVINKIFELDELPIAYDYVNKGHLRGKIVIKM